MKVPDQKTLENIFKRKDILWQEFIEIASTAGYRVSNTWNRETQCVVLKKKTNG